MPPPPGKTSVPDIHPHDHVGLVIVQLAVCWELFVASNLEGGSNSFSNTAGLRFIRGRFRARPRQPGEWLCLWSTTWLLWLPDHLHAMPRPTLRDLCCLPFKFARPFWVREIMLWTLAPNLLTYCVIPDPPWTFWSPIF